MAKQFVKWLVKTVVDTYDPERNERVKRLADKLYSELMAKRKQFDLNQSIHSLEIAKGELREVKDLVFCRVLDNVWRDGIVSESEQKAVNWVQASLALPLEAAAAIRRRYAIEQFRTAFRAAMQDGVLSDDEYAHLDHIAASENSTAAKFCRDLFVDEGESIVQAMFLSCIENGTLNKSEWSSAVSMGERLGILKSDLHKLISVPAMRFVEHVLADAKSGEEFTQGERSQIKNLLTTFNMDSSFCEYVRREMDDAELRGKIAQGRLPIIPTPSTLELKAGEMVHGVTSAELIIVRNLKSGLVQDSHQGSLFLLDSRAVFQGSTRAESFQYRSLIGTKIQGDVIKFQLKGKPVWTLRLRNATQVFPMMFSKAISLANQTAVRVTDGVNTRHIPRDVRQRIWVKYGGQCVDCSAKDYLEFDHIIPVAKGGSNLDANVQLLCRRCNQKKSDHI